MTPTRACPYCHDKTGLDDGYHGWLYCSVCGRSCRTRDAEFAAQRHSEPLGPGAYRKADAAPEATRAAKAARVMKALFVHVPLSDAEKRDDPDYGL